MALVRHYPSAALPPLEGLPSRAGETPWVAATPLVIGLAPNSPFYTCQVLGLGASYSIPSEGCDDCSLKIRSYILFLFDMWFCLG
jgi:hypothetical protein